MKKNYLLFVLSLIISTVTFSQSIVFQKTYNIDNNNEANDIFATSEGELFIAGSTVNDLGNKIILIIKTDTNGDTLWIKTYCDDSTSFAQKIIHTNDGNYLIAGGMNRNSFLLKINSEGDSLWSMSFPSEHETAFKDVVELPNSDLVLINWIYFVPINSNIIKMDSGGNIDWATTGNWHECNRIKLCSDNEFLLSGWEGSVFDPTVYLLKYDLLGNLVFHKQFTEFLGQNRCMDISGENVFLGGFKESGTIPSIIKTNLEGNTEEWNDLANTQPKIVDAITIDSDNRIMTCSTDWWETIFITGLNTNGEMMGEVEIEMTFPSITSCTNINNSFYATGKFASENDGYDIFLIKLNIDSLFVGINENGKPIISHPTVFPNPANDKVFIEIPPKVFNKEIIIELRDNSGQQLKAPITHKENIFTISTINLAKGVYYVSISILNHPTITKKIIIVK
ncbi:MAG: hypothetical protein DRJ05_09620 [Bacteroidetes bacterium]|nr:MAG: hypothetical protein DRJ05_09620 [Bacteroidota bacterium]